MKYYVDKRIGQVVSEKDIDMNFLAPELYYEYRSNGTEDIITETWQYKNGLINFSYLIPEEMPVDSNLNKLRELHFEENNVQPYRLAVYAVPDKWFTEETGGNR